MVFGNNLIECPTRETKRYSSGGRHESLSIGLDRDGVKSI